MALFSLEEICEDCDNAVVHKCCGQFCYCKVLAIESCDYCHGTCPSHSDESRREHK